jgi:hypothetical protein
MLTEEDARQVLEDQAKLHKQLTTQALAMISLLFTLAIGIYYVNQHLPVWYDPSNPNSPMGPNPIWTWATQLQDAKTALDAAQLALSVAVFAVTASLIFTTWSYGAQARPTDTGLQELARQKEHQLLLKTSALRGSALAALVTVCLLGWGAAHVPVGLPQNGKPQPWVILSQGKISSHQGR